MHSDPTSPFESVEPSSSGQTPQGQPGQPPLDVPGATRAPQVQKKSHRRRLWIALSSIAVLLVLAGLIFAVSWYTSSVTNAPVIKVVNQYYNAIEKQDYHTAYSYVQPGTVQPGTVPMNGQQQVSDETIYTQVATLLDTFEGPVTAYRITSVQVQNDKATVMVQSTRSRSITNSVELDLRKIGNDWKIVGYDGV